MVIGNKYNVKLTDFADVTVCDVDKNQHQSSYLLIDGVMYYAEMLLHGSLDKYTHYGTIKDMKRFINLYPNTNFNLYTIEYMSILSRRNNYKRMVELEKIFIRDYKLNKILNESN